MPDRNALLVALVAAASASAGASSAAMAPSWLPTSPPAWPSAPPSPPPSAKPSPPPSSSSAPAKPKPPPSSSSSAPAKPSPPPSSAPPSRPSPPKSTFDREAAAAALDEAALSAKTCGKGHGRRGTATVVVTFVPAGDVSSANVQGPPFAGTAVGECVGEIFRRVKVPKFTGPPKTLRKSVPIP